MKILRVDEVGDAEPDTDSMLLPWDAVPPPSTLVPLPLLPPLSRFFTDAFRRRRIDDLNEPCKSEYVTNI